MPYRSPYQAGRGDYNRGGRDRGDHDRDGDRDRHRDRDRFFYGGFTWPWLLNSYAYLGYPDFYEYPPWWDYDDSDDSEPYAPQGPPAQDYNGQPPPEEQPDSAALPPWPSIYSPQASYPPPGAPQPPAQPPAPAQEVTAPQPAGPVTLVFNDGRPPEKIHNYLVTAGTLYVMDQQHQEIPVAELDLAATAKINRAAGVDFMVPAASR